MGYNTRGGLWRHIFGDGLTGKEYAYDMLGRLKQDSWIHYDGPQNVCNGEELGPDGNLCTEPPTGWFQDSSVTFAYDSVGNRRDKGGQYGTGNRIETFDNCTYETDADGNVTQRACGADTVWFAWTAESRLRHFILLGDTIKFDYDAGGWLVRKRVNGMVVRHFLWHGEELLAELNSAGTAKVAEYSYYPGLDKPHAVIVGTTAYFAHRDAVGNVIALTDAAQQVRRTYDYDAWGQGTGGTDYADIAGADRARFKGALWIGEETELYYMRARWYEPKSGRFLSEDPLGILAGTNIYVFASSDPVNKRDPTGLCAEDEDLWVNYRDVNRNGSFDADDIVNYFYCLGGGGGGVGKGGLEIADQRVDPNACPAPPVAPPSANLLNDIRKGQMFRLANALPPFNVVGHRLFIAAAWKGGVMDYATNDGPEYDPYGNFTYGAVGTATGYPEDLLMRMSGWAHYKFNLGLSPDLGRALLENPPPYWDNAVDRGNITAGIQYYNNACYAK